jgi:diguanylate cyclase (GGDEF)-like protein
MQKAPLRIPRLTDYFALKVAEVMAATNSDTFLVVSPGADERHGRPGRPRAYDEKFQILQAPSLLLPDLAYYRDKCDLRNTSLAVAYIDIDDFKRLNTAHGEDAIDRDVLPRFMETLEGHLFGHGYAYRFGGDEYVALAVNVNIQTASDFFGALRRKMGDLSFRGIDEHTTVSIGLCVADPDCFLTDQEIVERANGAKNFAKKKGKNCVAISGGPAFSDDELTLIKDGNPSAPC